MKILSQPKFAPCKCECCGTVFQIENGDEINSYCSKLSSNGEIVKSSLFGTCPVCGYAEVLLSVIGQEIPQSALC